MEEIVIAFWSAITGLFFAFFHSSFFLVIKIFLVIYSTVLIVDVILLVYLGGVTNQMRKMRRGTANIKVHKKKDQRQWSGIMERLKSQDVKQYQAAILEGDHFVYGALELQGYSGGNFAERLSQLPVGSFRSLDAVRDVHALSNKIINDKTIVITQDQAQNALGIYERFLADLDVL